MNVPPNTIIIINERLLFLLRLPISARISGIIISISFVGIKLGKRVSLLILIYINNIL